MWPQLGRKACVLPFSRIDLYIHIHTWKKRKTYRSLQNENSGIGKACPGVLNGRLNLSSLKIWRVRRRCSQRFLMSRVRGLHMALVQFYIHGYKNFVDLMEKESESGFRLWIVQYFVCQQMGFRILHMISAIIFFCGLYIYLPATLYNASLLWNIISIITTVTILYVLYGCYY